MGKGSARRVDRRPYLVDAVLAAAVPIARREAARQFDTVTSCPVEPVLVMATVSSKTD